MIQLTRLKRCALFKCENLGKAGQRKPGAVNTHGRGLGQQEWEGFFFVLLVLFECCARVNTFSKMS